MKIITINHTDPQTLNVQVDEDNVLNHVENTNYSKSTTNTNRLINRYLKKYNIKNCSKYYDLAGVIIIEKD